VVAKTYARKTGTKRDLWVRTGEKGISPTSIFKEEDALKGNVASTLGGNLTKKKRGKRSTSQFEKRVRERK